MIINGVQFDVELMDVLNELKSQLASNGIERFYKMFDSGEDIMCCCPYHKDGQERRPSAGIRKSDGLLHCLACGVTVGIDEVIANCFGYNDPAWGYRWLVSNFSTVEVEKRGDIEVDLERNNISDKGSIQHSRLDIDIPDRYVSEEELDGYRYTHAYLYKRGLTDEVIELFDLGYDRRTDSITFPVRYWGSMDFGKTLFVAKRQIKTKRFDLPKDMEKPLYGLYEIWLYLTMMAFDKGRGQNAKFKYADKIYVCEGLFDCLRLWCNGKMAVAGFGCLYSKYQMEMLQGLPTRHLVLAFDDDRAGRYGAERVRKQIKGKLITEVILPEGRKDIGECTDEEIQNLKEVF